MHVTSAADFIVLWLLLIAGMFGWGTERIVHASFAKTNGKPEERVLLQDSVLFLSIVAISTAALLPPVFADGVDTFTDTLARSRSTHIGWAMTAVVLIHVTAPGLVAILLAIGRHRRTTSPTSI